ncbi:hypothetical protein [Thalassospira xiamenensis]|uniref:hypothetical protein n=1 Tax=Thalassospira xiamenensis TaxID=220697 RepID=UPI003AA9D7E5
MTYLPTDPKSGRYSYPRVQAEKLALLMLFFSEFIGAGDKFAVFHRIEDTITFISDIKKGRRNGDLYGD